MNKSLPKKEKGALDEFKKALLDKLDKDILELKLFGSKARGDFRKESDIDVLIVLKKADKKNQDIILNLAVKMLLKYGLDISPHIYSQKEFAYLNNIPTAFMQILDREAVPL